MSKKILLSGIQPSGIMHIGNYFGAIKQFVDLQNEYESFVFIADLHALTTVQDKKTMEKNVMDVLLDYLACGLDPEKITLFKQSDIPEVAELAWIFNCITTMPYLERALAYKDAGQKAKEVTVGLFDYPMLMAADILIENADVVPVGADQKQHIEYARDTAEKFNRIWGETFKLPEPLILPTVAIVPGTDGRKMSKSYGNTILLFATHEEIKKAVMGIVTDSSEGVPKNVYEIHKLFRDEKELAGLYKEKKGKYKELKEALIEDIENFVGPMREKREALVKDKDAMLEILREGGKKAKVKAEKKMKEVREKIGVTLY